MRLVLLLAATLVGGLLPLRARESERLLHRFLALTTGLFLGILSLHLLPDALGMEGGFGWPLAAAIVTAGAGLLFALEKLALPAGHGRDPHVTIGFGSALGLSVHAFAEGLGLAALGDEAELASVLFVSVLFHKLAEGFSLATVFSLAGSPRSRVVALVAAFALVTPLGLVLGDTLAPALPSGGKQAFEAFAAGTFLYVALGDLLPEVFHGRVDLRARLALAAAGVAAAGLLHAAGG